MKNWPEPLSAFLVKRYEEHRNGYMIIAVFLGMVAVAIFRLLSLFVLWLPWDLSTSSVAISTGLCLALQLIGIPWLILTMRESFMGSHEGIPFRGLYSMLRIRSHDRVPMLTLVIIVVFPFIILYVLAILHAGGLPFYAAEHTIPALAVDLMNIVIGFPLLYMLAIILWLLVITSWALHDASEKAEGEQIKVDIFNPDGVGGLGSIQAFVRTLLSYYFIVIALLIVSYLSPTRIWSYEAFFVIALFFAGIIFFFIGFGSIRKIVRRNAFNEIKPLNERIITCNNHLQDHTKEESIDETYIKNLKTVLDACWTERERLVPLYERNTAYDVRTIGQSFGALLIPVLSFVLEMTSGFDWVFPLVGLK